MRRVLIEPTWASFRAAARQLLAENTCPDTVSWEELGAEQNGLALAPKATLEAENPGVFRVPRRFVSLGAVVACHDTPSAWPWLYRVLHRIRHGERHLTEDAADPDISRLVSMERAVRRDAHKMKAFVRFRSVGQGDQERFVAWFEPRHRIVRNTAPFFQRRFPSMRWSILTPRECVHWDRAELSFTPGVPKSQAPEGDDLEVFWLTYYAHTFNPARVRVKAMRAEMPVYYWKNLPEAESISRLLREAPSRVREMVDRAAQAAPEADADVARLVGPGTVSILPEAHMPPAREIPPTPGIRVGVAGWDYPDWAGLVYPEGLTGVARLRWVASRFHLIEVNSTFYRPVSVKAAGAWIERTAEVPRFQFSSKLYRRFTHESGPWSERDVDAVRTGMSVLRDAGRLVSILVQFPWSFRNRVAERERLERITKAFAEFPLHVEVRHGSWDVDSFRKWLSDRSIGLVNIDQPLFPDSIVPSSEATSRVAYLRFHGRNAENWFREDANRDERYDYFYSPMELESWLDRALELSERKDVDEVNVVFNNHYCAQAVRNAEGFADALARMIAKRRKVSKEDAR